MRKIKITTIGGGTGSFTTLLGLKKYPVELSSIITMMDDGGSSGKLRDELGVLPPGDIRQCIVALAKSSRLLRDLFNYRYLSGGLKGHTFGNIFLSTLEKQTGSIEKAINEIGKILSIKGKVIPVTFNKSKLCVQLESGKRIKGEHHIDVSDNIGKRDKIKKAYLLPQAKANPEAIKVILNANYILVGPGDLYTSIIPNLLVLGISSAIRKSKAKKIYVMNLMTKYGQTTFYKTKDHINDLEKYLGLNVINTVLINNKNPSRKTLRWYKKHNEEPVVDNLNGNRFKIVKANLIKDLFIGKTMGDELRRSIIRHDPDKLAKKIMQIILDKLF
jgi:uncharacterized cofD-like protein